MKRWTLLVFALLGVLLVGSTALPARPGGGIQILSKEELGKLLPASVFLDGEKAPVQKRNAVGARSPQGKILLVTLIDTSGFSSGYQEKYVGMLLTDGEWVIGESRIKPGAYGLGRKKSTAGPEASQTFVLYDIGGGRVAEIPATRDAKLRPVTPIQLKIGIEEAARLYLGRYFVTFSSR